MIKFSINDLRETSIADLKCIQFVIEEELTRRENEKRKEDKKMNVKILYSVDCAVTIRFHEGHELASAEWGNRFTNLQDAIDMSKYILRYVYPHSATGIVIWDGNTGEVLAEIEWDE